MTFTNRWIVVSLVLAAIVATIVIYAVAGGGGGGGYQGAQARQDLVGPTAHRGTALIPVPPTSSPSSS